MTRQEINQEIQIKTQKKNQLKEDIKQLKQADLLLCDDVQQYYEKEVEVIISKRPKKVEVQTHGFVKWKEYFRQKETGETVEIERNLLVRVNGEFL